MNKSLEHDEKTKLKREKQARREKLGWEIVGR